MMHLTKDNFLFCKDLDKVALRFVCKFPMFASWFPTNYLSAIFADAQGYDNKEKDKEYLAESLPVDVLSTAQPLQTFLDMEDEEFHRVFGKNGNDFAVVKLRVGTPAFDNFLARGVETHNYKGVVVPMLIPAARFLERKQEDKSRKRQKKGRELVVPKKELWERNGKAWSALRVFHFLTTLDFVHAYKRRNMHFSTEEAEMLSGFEEIY